MKPVKSELIVRATAELNEEIKKDLGAEKPTEEKAMGVLKEACKGECQCKEKKV